MSAINYTLARDEIYAEAYNAVQNNASPFGYVPEIRYKDDRLNTTPDASKVWMRFSMDTVIETQSGLSNDVTGPGKRRFCVDGLFFIQIFAPMSQSDTREKVNSFAQAIKDALRKHKGDVILRNIRVNELPTENMQYRLNVVAQYEYDEIS
jgi:hypothetical protein